MVDYHIHSDHSFDADSSLLEIALYGAAQGLSEICITEHMEVPLTDIGDERYLDFPLYDADLSKARQAVDGITIKQGVEIGLSTEFLDAWDGALKQQELDFVIASQHLIGGKDPWFGDFFDHIKARDGQQAYLEEMLHNLRRFDYYNVIGHIGYLDKYMENATDPDARPFIWDDFPDLIDEILKEAITHGKGIEVNTSGYDMMDSFLPHESIIRRFFELGGEIVTVGSDAHFAQVVGRNIQLACEVIDRCGGKYVCTFDHMKPSFHTIQSMLERT